MGLIVCRVDSCLYTLDQILDFVRDIEVDLKAVQDALKAGGDPSKRHAFCLFVSNYGGTMSIPTDPPYCLIYLTSYVRDVEPDHFDTHNNSAGTCLCHCICHAMLQFTNDDPDRCREYSWSQLILPHGAQYKERLFPKILRLWNHQEPLTDPTNGEPYPMELVGDFRATDPIFKGCYRDSLLYTSRELDQLRWQGIHLPLYRSEIPTVPAPSYQQARQPKVMKQSPPRAATPSPPVESPKAKHSGGKGGPLHASGYSSSMSTPKCPDSTSTKKPSSSKEPTSNGQGRSPKAHRSHKHGHSPSPSTKSVRCKWKDVHMEGNHTLNSTLPVSSSAFDSLCSPMGSHTNGTEPLHPYITSAPLGLGGPRQ